MKSIVLVGMIVNVVYIMVWILVNKLRNSKNKIIREYDNGNEFYESLSELDKEKYWREDTKNINLFFLSFLVFIEIALFLYGINSILWIISLSLGFIISLVVVVILSVRLKKKYR